MNTGSLRITHVVTNANFAGTERYAAEVGSELAARGHDVVVIGGDPEKMAAAVHGPAWRPGSTSRDALAELRRGGRRDVVHSHIPRSDFLAVGASAWTRAARVSTRHITAPRGYRREVRLLGRGVRRLLATEIAVSRWTSDQLSAPSDVVLLNGVPEVPAGPARRERTVLVAQRLAPEKDTSTALRAWASSVLPASGWRLVVAGSGELADALAREASDLGVGDTVDFLGWADDLGSRLASTSIFLAPAPTEPCGLTILEAMATATPVLAASSGGNVETIGSFPGAALFPPGDAAAAAALLDRWGADETARAAYGIALQALQRERFSISVHVDALENLYREAAARRRLV